MPSSYTGLGVQLMNTGEKSGTWGTLTNTNWNIIEQISGGYIEVAVTSTPTTLAVNDGTTGAALAHRCITFTGEISENTVVTIPLDVQTFYIIKNSVSGGASSSYTVQFKYVSGSGSSVTWAAGDTGTKIIYATADDATNPNIVDATSAFVTATSTTTLTNKTLTSPKIGTSILDTNGLELMKITATGSAENEFTMAAGASGAGPTLSSTGSSDTNIDINVVPAGTGNVNLSADAVQIGDNNANATLTTQGTGDLILNTNNGSNAGNITLLDGANGNIDITTNGTGAIKFNDMAYVPQVAITSTSNAVAWDAQAASNAYHVTTENTIFSAPTNAVEGAFVCLEINYSDAHTIGWNTIFEFAASTEPTETAADTKTDLHVFRYNGAIWQEVGRTLNLSES